MLKSYLIFLSLPFFPTSLSAASFRNVDILELICCRSVTPETTEQFLSVIVCQYHVFHNTIQLIGCLHMTSLLWREMQLEGRKRFFPIGISSRNSRCLCFALFMNVYVWRLAIVYGCEKFSQYLYGKTVRVQSDHKPLETVFKKPLQKAPPRLQRMLMKLQPYDLQVSYKPGKELKIADALSRAFLEEETEQLLDRDLEVHQLSECLPMSEEKFRAVKEATVAADKELQMVMAAVKTGWPKLGVTPISRQFDASI